MVHVDPSVQVCPFTVVELLVSEIVPVVVIGPPVSPVPVATEVTPVLATVQVPVVVIVHVPLTDMPVPAAMVALVTVPMPEPDGTANVPSARKKLDVPPPEAGTHPDTVLVKFRQVMLPVVGLTTIGGVPLTAIVPANPRGRQMIDPLILKHSCCGVAPPKAAREIVAAEAVLTPRQS
jgi:hypothetical protein